MARFVLLPFGSAGDVFPFLWMGRALRRRGHEVIVVTACLFEEAVRGAGLEFVPIGKPEDFEELLHDPRLWTLSAGTKLVMEHACKAAGTYFDALQNLRASGRAPDIVAAPMTAFAGRMEREKHGTPLVTVHLQPAALLSAWETPVLFPGMQYLRKAPLWIKKLVLRLPNPIDRLVIPRLRVLCQAGGIPPPRSLLGDWWNSPDGVLLLFPEWFAAPQPDWPAPRLQWDFPLEDLRTEQPLSAEFLAFCGDANDKPLLVTAGSANLQAREYFSAFIKGIQLAGRRAILVTRDATQLPAELPRGFFVAEYVPFGPALTHAAGFIHHGGIGTLSQGMAAGVPQLISPLAHDQFDNADRLVRLGTGLPLSKRRLSPPRIAALVRRLVADDSIAQKARSLADNLRQRDASIVWEWLEARLPAPAASHSFPPQST